jgi:CBS domain-containing protein
MGNKEHFNDLIKSTAMDVSSDCLVTSSRPWLEVGDVTSKSVVTISPNETAVSAALKMMSENNVSCIVVVEDGSAVGIITETDFLRKVAKNEKDFDKIKVAEIMSSPVVSVPSNVSVFEAGRVMKEGIIKRLPILEDGRLAGIVTQTDLIRVLASYGMWRDAVEVMTEDVAGVQQDATVAEAAEIMTARNISCIVALQGNEAVGVLTERDLLKRVIAPQKDPAKVKMAEVMSSPVMSVPPGCSVFSASKIMEKSHIRRLVVMENKQLCGIITQTDIFRAVEKKLQAEEEKNFRLLERCESGIYTLNLDGKITYVNSAFTKLLELPSRVELVNQPFLPERFWFNPEDREQFLREMKKGSVEIKELALKTAKCNLVYVTLFSTFTKNVNGQINGSQGILYDITAKKEFVALREAEEALRESKQQYHNVTSDVQSALLAVASRDDSKIEAYKTLGLIDTPNSESARKSLENHFSMLMAKQQPLTVTENLEFMLERITAANYVPNDQQCDELDGAIGKMDEKLLAHHLKDLVWQYDQLKKDLVQAR